MSVSTDRASLPEGCVIEGYRFARRLNAGGFSIVYLGYDADKKPVAIKEYLPEGLAYRKEGLKVSITEPENAAAFRMGMVSFFEEGKALAGIQHPNIVRVLNFFRANETVYMVMAYERGRTLASYVQNSKTGILEENLRYIFANLLNGLREVHTRRLLHLDIKPGNIYLRHNGSPVLLDFGAARNALTGQANSAAPMYTPGYAAPELSEKDGDLGPWTDLYGVGATMYACIVGKPPVSARERRNKSVIIPATKAGEGRYSRALLQLIDDLLELNIGDRPQSVYAVQKIIAAPPEPPESRNLVQSFIKLIRR